MPKKALSAGESHDFGSLKEVKVTVVAPANVKVAQATLQIKRDPNQATPRVVSKLTGTQTIKDVFVIKNVGPATVNLDFS